MARSLKKGPFADAHLLKKVDAMNAAGQKQEPRPGMTMAMQTSDQKLSLLIFMQIKNWLLPRL